VRLLLLLRVLLAWGVFTALERGWGAAEGTDPPPLPPFEVRLLWAATPPLAGLEGRAPLEPLLPPPLLSARELWVLMPWATRAS
jgi:hypothetical protein